MPRTSAGILLYRLRPGWVQEFPEIDRAAWSGLEDAAAKLVAGQVPFLDRLRDTLG